MFSRYFCGNYYNKQAYIDNIIIDTSTHGNNMNNKNNIM